MDLFVQPLFTTSQVTEHDRWLVGGGGRRGEVIEDLQHETEEARQDTGVMEPGNLTW